MAPPPLLISTSFRGESVLVPSSFFTTSMGRSPGKDPRALVGPTHGGILFFLIWVSSPRSFRGGAKEVSLFPLIFVSFFFCCEFFLPHLPDFFFLFMGPGREGFPQVLPPLPRVPVLTFPFCLPPVCTREILSPTRTDTWLSVPSLRSGPLLDSPPPGCP